MHPFLMFMSDWKVVPPANNKKKKNNIIFSLICRLRRRQITRPFSLFDWRSLLARLICLEAAFPDFLSRNFVWRDSWQQRAGARKQKFSFYNIPPFYSRIPLSLALVGANGRNKVSPFPCRKKGRVGSGAECEWGERKKTTAFVVSRS